MGTSHKRTAGILWSSPYIPGYSWEWPGLLLRGLQQPKAQCSLWPSTAGSDVADEAPLLPVLAARVNLSKDSDPALCDSVSRLPARAPRASGQGKGKHSEPGERDQHCSRSVLAPLTRLQPGSAFAPSQSGGADFCSSVEDFTFLQLEFNFLGSGSKS